MQNTDAVHPMNSNHNHSIVTLTAGDKEVLLIGTAHVSQESADLADRTIRDAKPDTVCVELCESRFQAIRQKDRWQEMDIVKVIREKKAFLLLSNLLLASFQRRIANKFNIVPGQEMIAAVEAAESVGAGVHLVDREIRITLSRIWRLMGFWQKSKLLFQLILSVGDADEITEEDIERMKEEDVLETLLAEIGKSLPVLRNILIDERDQYLAHKIRNAPGNKIVAVVGAGHVPGIRQYWDKEIDVEALEVLPPPNKLSSVLKWVLPLAIMALFVWGFFQGRDTGKDMIFLWIATTGILAGLGSIVALAHPLSVLSAVLSAPLAALHPMIATGWVSGLVEAVVRKPRVRDFEALSEDILSVKGFWRNKVARILLVVVFTNLGCMFGTLVAIPLLLRLIR